MKKAIGSVILSLVAAVSVAADETNQVKSININTLTKEQRRAIIEEYRGGYVEKTSNMQGKIVFVNAQKTAPRKWVEESGTIFNSHFRNKLRFNVEVKDGTFEFPAPKIDGEVTLFVIDDAKMPQSLVASESRWAMVNVARLREGDGAKPQFFEARVKKAITRGISVLCGAPDSSYPRCLLTCMTKPEQLDVNPDCRLPVDVIGRFEKYLVGYGVKPAQIKTYRKACQEGWAPQPTNDLQKAIWNQVHELPSNPIKIKYDPKKGE